MNLGRNGERYILANKTHTSLQKSVEIAANLYPILKLKTPKKIPKSLLYFIAILMEIGSKISGNEPQLQRSYIDMFYGLKQDYNISKSIKELNFSPKSSKKALEDALSFLKDDWQKA